MNKEYDFAVGAERLAKVEASPIRTILDRAAAMRQQGLSVIPFSAGEPDFDTPSDIKEATIQAINKNLTHYTSNRGYPALRGVLQDYIKRETGIEYNPETEIILTCGAAEALNNVLLTFVDEGDEVIVLTPAFVSYKCLVNMCGAKFVEVPLDAANGFQIDVAAVKAAVTEKTKMLMLNNPSNPTGAVFNHESLAELCALAREHNFMILADEIYSRLVYDGKSFSSIASFEGMKERAVIVSGFSKTFAMTGWRLGYIATDERLANRIMRTHQYSTTCSPTFIQAGLSEAIESERTKAQVEEMIQAFANRRRMVLDALDEIEGLSYIKPYGAFYVMVDTSGLGLTGAEFVEKLLSEKYVATVPAAGMGCGCDNFVRISYATSEENIREGMRRIAELARELKE